jgi:hypothetical protein
MDKFGKVILMGIENLNHIIKDNDVDAKAMKKLKHKSNS